MGLRRYGGPVPSVVVKRAQPYLPARSAWRVRVRFPLLSADSINLHKTPKLIASTIPKRSRSWKTPLYENFVLNIYISMARRIWCVKWYIQCSQWQKKLVWFFCAGWREWCQRKCADLRNYVSWQRAPGMVSPGSGRPAPRRFWHSGMPDPNGAAARSQAGFTFSLWKEAKSAHRPARSQRSWAESQAESHFLQSRRSNSHSGLPGWARYGLSRVRPLAGFGTAAYRMLTGRWQICQSNKPPTNIFSSATV